MTEALAPYAPPQAPERYSVSEVIDQVKVIQQIMDAVMKEGVHYGTIPGTDKPTIYKAGAEKLCLTFRLAPRYFGEDEPKDLGRGHREYIIRCELYHIGTGRFLGAGVGSCSTMESKYRYRDAFEVTGKPVPQAYWKDRNASLLGGSGFRPKKIDGQWQIVKVTERQENPDIADTFNTVLKMAKKRAHNDAVLTATAASDIFTQDLEDLSEETNGEGKAEKPASKGKSTPKPEQAEAPNPAQEVEQQTIPTEDGWRKDFKETMTKMAGSEAKALTILGQHGYETWEQVPNRQKALDIYADVKGKK